MFDRKTLAKGCIICGPGWDMMVKVITNYRLGWILIFGSLVCGTTAASIFQFLNYEKFITAAFLQISGVFLALALAYFFFEIRSQTRQQRIDETVGSSVALIRTLATSAVITATGKWWDKPPGHESYGPTNGPKVYKEARELVLNRSHLLKDYLSNVYGCEPEEWVFRKFDRLAFFCRRMIQTAQPGLVEYGALIRAMQNLEINVASEKQAWEEFPKNEENHQISIPSEAGYNLYSIAELTVRLIDVLDSKDFGGDPEYEARRKFAPELFYRSNNWGIWRR